MIQKNRRKTKTREKEGERADECIRDAQVRKEADRQTYF